MRLTARMACYAREPNAALTILMAAASALKRQSGATGPKVSSLVMTISVVTSVSTVGSKKVPPGWRGLLKSLRFATGVAAIPHYPATPLALTSGPCRGI